MLKRHSMSDTKIGFSGGKNCYFIFLQISLIRAG